MNKAHKQSAPRSTGSWVYGQHAVTIALSNPKRRVQRLLITDESALSDNLKRAVQDKKIRPEITDKKAIDHVLGPGTVHQGIAALMHPLPEIFIEDILEVAQNLNQCNVVILDQVTDPHNIGAIMRSAAAFGSLAVIVQDKNSPEITGVLAKSASGAVDLVPLVRVVNISRAMEQLKEANFWCLGMDPSADKTLAQCDLKNGKVALVLGAEGDGMRRLVADTCDALVKLPMRNAIGSLNVSNAGAIALYELVRDQDVGIE
jgi:23S rRNA (guanosine2251-2'-O)-methyltransferase